MPADSAMQYAGSRKKRQTPGGGATCYGQGSNILETHAFMDMWVLSAVHSAVCYAARRQGPGSVGKRRVGSGEPNPQKVEGLGKNAKSRQGRPFKRVGKTGGGAGGPLSVGGINYMRGGA